MPSYVDINYGTLEARKNRVDSFFGDLENKLAAISAPTIYHLDIWWDGSKVKIIITDEQISGLSLEKKLKYYEQGLGLMKIAMNKSLYPA